MPSILELKITLDPEPIKYPYFNSKLLFLLFSKITMTFLGDLRAAVRSIGWNIGQLMHQREFFSPNSVYRKRQNTEIKEYAQVHLTLL